MKRISFNAAVLVGLLVFFAGHICLASVEEGDRLMKENKYKEAAKHYEEALGEDPGNPELLASLARAYDAANWYGRSIKTWETYLEKFPDGEYADEAKQRAAFAHRWVGVQFYQTGQPLEEAVEHLEKATKLRPGLFEARYWLGRMYFEKSMFEKAAGALEKALDISPGNDQAEWLLEQSKGAIEHGGKAYELYTRAYNLYEKGDLDAALEMYRKAESENEEFVSPVIWIARIYMEQGEYDAAIEYWREVLDLDPENERAKWFLIDCNRKKREAEKQEKE